MTVVRGLRRRGAIMALVLVASCAPPPAAPQRDTQPARVAPQDAPVVSAPDATVPATVYPAARAPSAPTPAIMPTPVFTPLPAPVSAPGLPQGPVTNYGTGGMQAPPGAPPNPPYPPGGLMR